MTTTSEILFDVMPGKSGDLGIVTLNRPQVLNSINLHMIKALHAQLKVWATMTSIKAVVIRAVPGKAFCAGGDIRLTYERSKKGEDATEFFFDEYHLNQCIFHFPKPYIALLDGITMGGGVGISIHGSHRIATENLLFAMPETAIGFFPDVGGTYFLPRLPGYLGYYLGLTGARIKTDDCVSLGIAQHKVTQDQLSALLVALAEGEFSQDAKASVTQIIKQFESPITSSLMASRTELDACFAKRSMEEIVQALQHASQPLCQDAANLLLKRSPTSLKVTLRALQEHATMSFDECMQREFGLAAHFVKGHDFIEGIRAVIIDKDQAPAWRPAILADVTHKEVAHYFEPALERL